MQKLLKIITLERDLRAKADAWDSEDGDLVRLDKVIGLSNSPYIPAEIYQTPLHAIGDGWRLMAPPVFVKSYAKDIDAWEWWLQKGN